MPLPKPRPSEPSKEFIKRCMDSEVMKKEFPEHKQRLAVCHSQLKKK